MRSLTLTVAAVLLVLTGCSGSPAAAPGTTAPGKIAVVASTNVWAAVVSAIGGELVDVKAILADPGADPHAYEEKPVDAVQLSGAKLVVYNGGGYDEFFTRLIASSGTSAAQISAFDVSGKPTGGNEHIWYDLPTVKKVADTVAADLAVIAPDKKNTLAVNAKNFVDSLDALMTRTAAIGSAHPGKIMSTEPVAAYLIEQAGLTDATPQAFAKAVQEENDPPAAAVASARDLITGKQVMALVDNVQTETSVTDSLTKAAHDSGVPVVGVTETMPAGVSGYLDWMGKQIDALSKAVGG